MTPAERAERKRLIAEGEKRQAVASFYEAHHQEEMARLQELADQNGWEADDGQPDEIQEWQDYDPDC